MNTLARTFSWYLAAPIVNAVHRTGLCSGLLALRGFERVRWQLGRLGAWLRYESARRTVPAYRHFLAEQHIAEFTHVPVTDKASYVKVYTLDERCEDGRLPECGIIFDESSGTSGQPTNWVRGVDERRANGRTIRLGLRKRFGEGPLFFLNAFALGPWATGVNITLSLSSWGRVKSLGPDLAKIANTLQQFGPRHHYVILGYPPFLKQIVDHVDVDWARYHVSMVFGGEGMSESMRRYLQERGIKDVFGSYGASDLELNIGAETHFTIALRRLMERRPSLAAKLLRQGGAMPMVFQFNPADFFIETHDTGELLVTVCRPDYLTPKVRYNIHDLGHVMRMPDVAAVLHGDGIDPASLDREALDLPLLFLYGRSDASVAYYGCKVAPPDVQEALFRLPDVATRVDAFQLETVDDTAGDKRLFLHLEVAPDDHPQVPDEWATRVFDALAAVNQDFRESRRMAPVAKPPTLVLHVPGTGPFASADIRVKRQYIAVAPA